MEGNAHVVETRLDERRIELSHRGASLRLVLAKEDDLAVVFRVVAGDDASSLDALAQAVRAHTVGCEKVLTWEGVDVVPLTDALVAAGFTEHRRKLFVMRDLTLDLPRSRLDRWRTLEEMGETAFVELLHAASEGDPFSEDDFDPQEEWRGLLAHAGASFDAGRWRAAIVDGEPAGIVLPTPYPGAPEEGTLSYLGVLPSSRGRGLGRELHAAGLRLLSDAGCKTYKGSTDVRNAPMAAVFRRNGCAIENTQVFLRHPVPPREGE